MRRSEGCFDEIRPVGAPVILCGAGNIGRRLAATLAGAQVGPVFFADRNPALQGARVQGLPVLAPEEAAARHGASGIFVVTAFNREAHSDYRSLRAAYLAMGARIVVPYAVAAWKFAATLLPHFAQGTPADVLPHAEDIVKAAGFFHDERSRAVFLELLRGSLLANYGEFADADAQPQYFPPQVLKALPEAVDVADCGAFDGDTLRDFLDILGPERLRSWQAFEPDMQNFLALERFVGTLPADLKARVHCRNVAVGEDGGTLRLSDDGTEASRVCACGGAKVPCLSLDEAFSERPCSFIKMDIEGHEAQALRGAAGCMRANAPALAVSVYHRPDDFFRIPRLVAALAPTHRPGMSLLRYGAYFYDAVLFATARQPGYPASTGAGGPERPHE